MRIVVAAAAVPQPSFGQQAPRGQAGRTDDLLYGPAPEVIRIAVYIHDNAVDDQLLTDIAGDDTRIIAVLLQVVV